MAEVTSSDPSRVHANITTNNKGWFQAVSPQFLELVGRPVEALAGVNIGDLIHPEDVAAVRAVLAGAAAGEAKQPVTARLFAEGERWLHVGVHVEAVSDDRLRVNLLGQPASLHKARPPAEPSPAEVAPTDPSPAEPSPAEVGVLAPVVVSVEPASPVDSDQNFPYDDSPEHLAYVATFPADHVPSQRAAVRTDAGDVDTPMIEIDPQGRTVFLSGDWASLSAGDAVGAEAFEELLGRSGKAEQVLDAMTSVFVSGTTSRHELSVPGLPPRWARVVPIPSPHQTNVVHALITIVPESLLDRPGVPVAPPSERPVDPFATDLPQDWFPAAAPATSAPPAAANAAGTSGSPTASETPPAQGSAPKTGDHQENEPADAQPAEAPTDEDEASTPPRTAAAKWTRWLVWALVAVVAILALVNLIGGDGDDPEEPDPITTELSTTQAVQVTDTQVWRAVGADSFGEAYGIATTDDGAFVADIQGRIIRLDAQGAAIGAAGLSGGAETFVSDLAHAGSGSVWVLDAGLGQISRVSPDGTVTRIDSNPDPLRNARGLGSGRNDTLWVASTAAAQLTHLNADGSLLDTIPLPGRQPSDVVELDDGSLWVVDAQEIELVHVGADGGIVTAIPLGSFSSVQAPHLAVAGDQLWVTEPDGSAVFSVDLATDQISSERIQISRPDGSAVVRPIGIDVGPDGRFWIVDSMGAGIVILDG